MKKMCLLMLFNIITCCSFAKIATSNAYEKSQPLLFVENIGQITDHNKNPRKDIHFKIQNESFSVFVSNKGLHYQWSEAQGLDRETLSNNTNLQIKQYRMDVELVGANLNAKVISENQTAYNERYYLEHLGLKGETARSFEKIIYKNVYPGIDWVLYSAENSNGKPQLKYDFIVHSGADLKQIKLKYSGSDSLKINSNGSFSATTPMGTITEDAPYSYIQAKSNSDKVQIIQSKYELKDNVLSFKVAPYSGTLVIDPALEWGTYYGGAGFDLGTVLACDFAGNVFLTGASWMGSNMTTTGSHQSINAGDFDAFLAKFDANGNRIWATYYGGSSTDYGFGLVCDQNNRVFISGTTQSSLGIATSGSHQSTYAGSTDNFLARFDSSGVLMWATYYGSSSSEYNGICTVDDDGHVFLAGYTAGVSNIANGGHQNTNGGGSNDAYLVKFDTLGTRIWATYYGGTGVDEADGIACDLSGNVYLSGNTNSPNNIATTGSHQPVIGGLYDNFLVKFNAAGIRQWATYYGGSGNEFNGYLRTVAVDKAGNAYICGHTQSTSGIATTGSHQSTFGGAYDAYLAKFNSSGVREWGTYYGGTGDENGGAIAIDFSGNIFWSGFTSSTTAITTTDAHQVNYTGGAKDAFLARFNNLGVLEYGTYYGGSDLDEGYAVGFDYIGNAYISGGTTSSNNIATTGSFSTVYGGGIAVYLAKFCTSVASTQIDGPDTLCPNSIVTYFASPLTGATAYIWEIPTGWTGASDSASLTVQTNGIGGAVSVRVVRCDTSAVQLLNVHIWPAVPAEIVANNYVLSTVNIHNSYQWLQNGTVISGATNPTYTVTANGLYTVAVTNSPDCKDTSNVMEISGMVNIGNKKQDINSIEIYPNPSEDKVYLKAEGDYSVRLLSLDGRVHFEGKNASTINIKYLNSGLYLLEFRNAAGAIIGVEKMSKK